MMVTATLICHEHDVARTTDVTHSMLSSNSVALYSPAGLRARHAPRADWCIFDDVSNVSCSDAVSWLRRYQIHDISAVIIQTKFLDIIDFHIYRVSKKKIIP